MNNLGIDEYQLRDWIGRLGSMPVERIAHFDASEGYDICEIHVFRLTNGQYATVIEAGCSCYDSNDAEIDLHENEQTAMKKFLDWKREIHGIN